MITWHIIVITLSILGALIVLSVGSQDFEKAKPDSGDDNEADEDSLTNYSITFEIPGTVTMKRGRFGFISGREAVYTWCLKFSHRNSYLKNQNRELVVSLTPGNIENYEPLDEWETDTLLRKHEIISAVTEKAAKEQIREEHPDAEFLDVEVKEMLQ